MCSRSFTFQYIFPIIVSKNANNACPVSDQAMMPPIPSLEYDEPTAIPISNGYPFDAESFAPFMLL